MLTNSRFDGRLIIDNVTQGYDLIMIIPKCGGFFFTEALMKPPFKKQPLSIDKQIELLKSRGMDITTTNEENLGNLLLHNNYYRLEGY